MSDRATTNDARRKALDRIEESEFLFKSLLFLMAFLEVGLGITLIVLTDFANRMHVLIFVAACMVYAPIVCGLAALWAHSNRNAQRILRAIELLAQAPDAERPRREVFDGPGDPAESP